ncbi:polycomb group RING finger protein 5 isoform X3 [Rhineura floridana]|uniref:polycomb group RING finger protein 5 isoform X3 n=1 Tax=Rhineura floridana TaxID=261503 RepID=UPI002AC840FB|nr:polycomb group RING finger protein 5 isoform X3 [Rhineura floridana]
MGVEVPSAGKFASPAAAIPSGAPCGGSGMAVRREGGRAAKGCAPVCVQSESEVCAPSGAAVRKQQALGKSSAPLHRSLRSTVRVFLLADSQQPPPSPPPRLRRSSCQLNCSFELTSLPALPCNIHNSRAASSGRSRWAFRGKSLLRVKGSRSVKLVFPITAKHRGESVCRGVLKRWAGDGWCKLRNGEPGAATAPPPPHPLLGNERVAFRAFGCCVASSIPDFSSKTARRR